MAYSPKGLPPRKLNKKKPGARPPGPSRVINDTDSGRMQGAKTVQVGYPIGGGRSHNRGRARL